MNRFICLAVLTFHLLAMVQNQCDIQLDLTIFRCIRQKLTEIPSHIHKNTINLDLSHNLIEILHEDSFSGLSVIQRLTLGNNRIYKITERAFLPIAENLTFLDLRNNQIVSSVTIPFPISAFAPLVNLKHLDLSGNPLGFLPTGFLRYMGVSLIRLDISSLAIGMKIEAGAFNGLSRVHYLNLAYNTFSELAEESLNGLRPEHFSHLNLDGVQWHCDCRILWLRRWLNRIPSKALQVTKKPGGECVTPPAFKGQTFILLNFTSLQCEPRILNTIPPRNEVDLQSPIHVIGYEGQNLTIMCAFISEPKMNVNWYHEGVLIQPHWSRITQTITPGTKFTTTLHFHGLRSDKHTGYYQCQASNQKGLASASFHLEVSSSLMGSTRQFIRLQSQNKDLFDYFGRIFLLIGGIIIANVCLALLGFITYKCIKKRRYNPVIKQIPFDNSDLNKQSNKMVSFQAQNSANPINTYNYVPQQPNHSLSKTEMNRKIINSPHMRQNHISSTVTTVGLASGTFDLGTPNPRTCTEIIKSNNQVSSGRFCANNRSDYGNPPLVNRSPSLQSSDMGYPGSSSSRTGESAGLTKELGKSNQSRQYYTLSLRSDAEAPKLVYSSPVTVLESDRDFCKPSHKSLDIFDEIRLMEERFGIRSSSSSSTSSSSNFAPPLQMNYKCHTCPVHGDKSHQKHDVSCALHTPTSLNIHSLPDSSIFVSNKQVSSVNEHPQLKTSQPDTNQPICRQRRHSMQNVMGSIYQFDLGEKHARHLDKTSTIPRSVAQTFSSARNSDHLISQIKC